MDRTAEVARKTQETVIEVKLDIDGQGKTEIGTGIPFFDHMLTLFGAHGFFDLYVYAKGDIDVDFHHTVEDVGLVLGDAWDRALGERKGIKRYGHAVTPMDEALCAVTIDLRFQRHCGSSNFVELFSDAGYFLLTRQHATTLILIS